MPFNGSYLLLDTLAERELSPQVEDGQPPTVITYNVLLAAQARQPGPAAAKGAYGDFIELKRRGLQVRKAPSRPRS